MQPQQLFFEICQQHTVLGLSSAKDIHKSVAREPVARHRTLAASTRKPLSGAPPKFESEIMNEEALLLSSSRRSLIFEQSAPSAESVLLKHDAALGRASFHLLPRAHKQIISVSWLITKTVRFSQPS